MRCAARLFAEVVCRAHEQRPAVVAAEHAGEDVQAVRGKDLVDDRAAMVTWMRSISAPARGWRSVARYCAASTARRGCA